MKSLKLLTVLLLCWSGALAWASDEEARYALVIGNAAYDGEASLANPVNDATDVAKALESVGWNVTRLMNGDRKAMNRTVYDFRDAVAKSVNPTVLFLLRRPRNPDRRHELPDSDQRDL